MPKSIDASPHTNYLFRFLKSDLHAGRRQKRNYNLHPHSVNLSNALTVEGIWVSATRLFVTGSYRKRPRSLLTGPRESTPGVQKSLTFLPHYFDAQESALPDLE